MTLIMQWMATEEQTFLNTSVHIQLMATQVLGGGWTCRLCIKSHLSEYTTEERTYGAQVSVQTNDIANIIEI